MENNKLRMINGIKYNTKTKNYAKALNLLDEYLTMYPNDYMMTCYKAKIYGLMGKTDECKKILEYVISTSKDLKILCFAHQQYGKNLVTDGELDEAEKHFLKVLNISDNEEIVTRYELSRIYQNKNNIEKAINILTIPDKDCEFLRIKRVCIYYHDKRNDEMKQELDKKIKNNIKNDFDKAYLSQQKHYYLAEYYIVKRDYEQAEIELRNALKLKNTPYYYEANISMMKILIYRKRYDEAISIGEMILNKKDSFNKSSSALHTILLGDCYTRRGYLNKAEKLFSDNKGNYGLYDYGMGKIAFTKRNFEEAVSLFEKSIEKSSQYYFDTYYYYASSLFRLKRYDEAYEILAYMKTKRNTPEESHMIDILFFINSLHSNRRMYINKENLSYSQMQILEYSKERAIKHIYINHVKNKQKSIFYEDTDLEKLFDNVTNKINESNGYCSDFYDKYMISIEDGGITIGNERVKECEVVVIPDTNKIITMYPYSMDFIDNLEEDKEEKPKIKRLSQIEKFNKKYNNL